MGTTRGKEIIKGILPTRGVEGGRVRIECSSFPVAEYSRYQLKFGGIVAPLSIVTSRFLVAEIPPDAVSGPVTLAPTGEEANGIYFEVGRRIASELHNVGNPAFDAEGNLLVTFSGARGQKVPVTIFKLDPEGKVHPFISDIPNPTGLALSKEDTIYVTSRFDGSLYQISRKGEIRVFAQGLGVATGIALDKEGNIFVGDRNGTIFKVSESGEARTFVKVPASVAAFHLAFGPDHNLYLSGPTLSTSDSILKITPDGKVSAFFSGLNRPQGLAFDAKQNLYVVAYLGGEGGVVKITPKGEGSLVIAGSNLVGLVFDNKGNLILASNHAVFRMPLGEGASR